MQSHQLDFHLEEYQQIRTEVAALLARIEQLFRYSLIVAALIFSWLLTTSFGAVSGSEMCLKLPKNFILIGWSIPTIVILGFGLMALVTNIRVLQMGEYLDILETALGAQGLGWEKFLRLKSSILTASTIIVWVLMLVLTTVAAGIGISSTVNAQVCNVKSDPIFTGP